MDLLPNLRSTQLAALEPGELFHFFELGSPTYAIKTQRGSEQLHESMVILGPFFGPDDKPFLLPYDDAHVVSYGKEFLVLPQMWGAVEDAKQPTCLALRDNEVFVCANGGPTKERYMPVFVSMEKGTVSYRHLEGAVAFTRTWRLAVARAGMKPLTLLEFGNHPGEDSD